jgi:hypothetical protein
MKYFFSLKAVTKLSTCMLFFCLFGCGSESVGEKAQVVETPEVESPTNTTTSAHAGADKKVQSSDIVLLTGVASDTEGTIDGYLWQQISGPTVSIIDVSDTDIQFTSPSVAEATDLEFKITVINSLGTEATDTIVVTVLPLGNTDSSQLYTTVTLQPDTEITPYTSELITFALPIAEGIVQDTSSIKVTMKGVEQAIFAKAGLRWHWSDNSIRSATIQLQNVDMTLGNIELTITNNGRD